MSGQRPSERRHGALTGVDYEHPTAFRLGATSVSLGILLQLPYFFSARDTHYQLRGRPVDGWMLLGIALVLVGLVAVAYGLFPRLSKMTHGPVSRIKVRAMDEAPIKASHIGLLVVMAAAVTIDVMKPTSLAFIAPGAAREYGLRSPLNPTASGLPVALYPLSGISGTVVGSFLWGWFGDKIGRRASIILAAVLFIAVSTCATMPTYPLNLISCFIMGLGVGGMLPITFALLAETIPARHRGWLMVLIGGDVAGAYIITSWIASTIAAPEQFGWRMLWLIGFPTGLILIVLNRWIPESPRFLLQHSRNAEATAIMERYGAIVVESDDSLLKVERDVRSQFRQLFSRSFVGLSAIVLLLGIGIGFVQFGFQQWIPSNLVKLGFKDVNAAKILRDSALIGFPLNFPIAWLYGFWSSKRTIVVLAAATTLALIGFVAAGPGQLVHDGQATSLLYVLLIVPIWGISSLTAVMIAYASEIYPTKIRARGSALAAGATKFGGVLILGIVAAAIAPPSIRLTAIYGAVPLVLGIGALLGYGVETKKKQLERITAEELHTGTA